jgi:hypothetical protein
MNHGNGSNASPASNNAIHNEIQTDETLMKLRRKKTLPNPWQQTIPASSDRNNHFTPVTLCWNIESKECRSIFVVTTITKYIYCTWNKTSLMLNVIFDDSVTEA